MRGEGGPTPIPVRSLAFSVLADANLDESSFCCVVFILKSPIVSSSGSGHWRLSPKKMREAGKMSEGVGPTAGPLGSRGCCILSFSVLNESNVGPSRSFGSRPFSSLLAADHEECSQRKCEKEASCMGKQAPRPALSRAVSNISCLPWLWTGGVRWTSRSFCPATSGEADQKHNPWEASPPPGFRRGAHCADRPGSQGAGFKTPTTPACR